MLHDLIFTQIYQMMNYFFLKSVFSSILGKKKYDRAFKNVQNFHINFSADTIPVYFIFVIFLVDFGESPKNWVMTVAPLFTMLTTKVL